MQRHIYAFMLGLIISISSMQLHAHNSLSAKYYLNVTKDGSVLSIHLSQVGVHAMMKKLYGEDAHKMSAEAYKKALVDYIKSHCDLYVGDKKIILGEGGIKLGTHQTDLKFLVDVPSLAKQNIQVSVPAFRENEYHQTLFAYNIYGKKDKVILSVNNDYRGEIILFQPPAPTQRIVLLIAIGLVSLILIVYLIAKRVSSSKSRFIQSHD